MRNSLSSQDGHSAARSSRRYRRWLAIAAGILVAVSVVCLVPSWWCGRDADRWYHGDAVRVRGLAEELVAFELDDDHRRATGVGGEIAGMWGLLAHQMTALGLAQVCLVHPEWRKRYAPIVTRAAAKSLLPEMRTEFTAACCWSCRCRAAA